MIEQKLEQSSDKVAEDNLPKASDLEFQMLRLKSVEEANSFVPAMCFYSPDGSVFVGIVLEETEDSFLVGASARMVMGTDRVVHTEAISSKAVLRVFKSSIRYMVPPTDMTTYNYFAFLQKYGYTYLSEFFTEPRRNLVDAVVLNSKYNNPEKPTSSEVGTSTESEELEAPGESPFSFVPFTLSESIH